MFVPLELILAFGKEINLVLLIGIAIFLGTAGAKLFQRFRIPQVVGWVVVGLIIGESGLNIINHDILETLSLFSVFALGVIGFMIGGELRRDVFKKHGKQFFIILFSEGISAFVLVGLLCGFTAWLFTGNMGNSVAMGLVLGAIASATAPAATANVLWEYKTRGPLTSTILAIVALDDGLSLLLFGVASSIAVAFVGQSHDSIWMAVIKSILDIIATIVLGIVIGFLVSFIVKRVKEPDKALVFIISGILLVVGLSVAWELGSILAAMTLGVTVANLTGRKRQSTFELIEKFSPPIYVLFFVLAGAHLVIGQIRGWMIVIVAVYLVARIGGKIFGSWFGALRSKAPASVRKYLGFCLLSQAGVAIGLSIISGHLFAGSLGQTIIIIVMTTTFIVEILGPLSVKYGVKKAGEVGLNITEDDLIKTYTVADVMNIKVPVISVGMSLNEVIAVVSSTDNLYYSVVDNDNKLTGTITLDGIRNTFATQGLNDWLVALDIMEPVIASINPDMALSDAFEKAQKLDIEYIAVVSSGEKGEFVGVLNCRKAHRALSAEVLSRQKKADNMHGAQFA